ncbi:uncharacterized protein LOC130896275 [Diorhabda carinulata]|uniref:uncharacterized protein LOC130896275 n=1 Tax=Diorhabda carinulata TaxID=1163345 RepID=UPI0025A13D72|nr:uncharacterized protein LOC130896275 [Diorhabda carinulata]
MNSTFLEVVNETLVEEDLLEDNQKYDLPKYDFLFSIIKYLLFILSALSDSLILFSYYKVKIIRNRNNLLLVHWASLNLYYFLHQLIIYELICSIILELKSSPIFLVVLSGTCLIFSYVVALALLIRWTALNFKYRLLQKIDIFIEKYLISFVYCLGVVIFICEYLHREFGTAEIGVITVDTVVIVAIIFNVLICFGVVNMSKMTVYILYVANSIISSVIPLIMYHYMFEFFISSSFVIDLIFFTRLIPQLIIFGHPVIVVVVLYRFSKDFNTAFKVTLKILSRSKEDYNDWIIIDEMET